MKQAIKAIIAGVRGLGLAPVSCGAHNTLAVYRPVYMPFLLANVLESFEVYFVSEIYLACCAGVDSGRNLGDHVQ